MTLLLAWLVFPLVLAALCLGCALLLERVSGTTLPTALLLPAGYAVVCVATQFAHLTDRTANLVTPFVVALAVAGFGLAWRRPPVDGWLVAAAAGAYTVFAAPVVLTGRATFLGYIKLDDTANYMALLDRALTHAYNTTGLAPSTYEALVSATYVAGYPMGAVSPLGVGSQLVGRDALWLWQPYLAFLAVLIALTLFQLVSSAIASRPLRAVVVVLGSQAALIFGYALWGGIKELATTSLVVLAIVLVRETARDPRPASVLPLAVGAAAVLHILSLAGAVWIAPPLMLALWLAYRASGARHALRRSGAFLAASAVLLVPAALAFADWYSQAHSVNQDDQYGNLWQRLDWIQVFGIWPNTDFRIPPDDLTVTRILVAVAAASAVVAVVLAWRRGMWEPAAAAGTVAFACAIYVGTGSPWIAGKALASSSPIVLTLALTGAAMIFARGRRVEGTIVASVIAVGVLWSNGLQYHEVFLAPEKRLAELESIGERFAGQGPALALEYEAYGTRHFLRRLDAEGPSELRRHFVHLRDGTYFSGEDTGVSADIDEINLPDVLYYKTLITRRSPVGSRPPSSYELVSSRRYYQVWQRAGAGERIVEHLSLGSRVQPAAVPPCGQVLRLARVAADNGGVLAAVPRPEAIVIGGDGTVGAPTTFLRYGEAESGILPRSATTVETRFVAPTTGLYGVWVGGSFRSLVEVFVDGALVGSARNVLQWPMNFVELGDAELTAGPHTFRLVYHDPDPLRPGSGGLPPWRLGPFAVAQGTQARPVVYVQPADARSLCGRTLDWVEALRG